ncbi:MAG: hypothetical protein WCF67_18145 [Chitinophagaceae bacterium]
MRQLFESFQCYYDNPLPAIILLLFGFIVGFYLWRITASISKKAPGDNLPKEVAKYFKDHFEHKWPASIVYPGTVSVVHDLKKLQEYLANVEKTVFDECEKDVQAQLKKCNQKGIAFYFGKSYSKHYLQDSNLMEEDEKVYRCVPRKEYTVFLLPVWYRECVATLEGRRCRPPRSMNINAKLPDKVKVFDLEYVSNPFEESALNTGPGSF